MCKPFHSCCPVTCSNLKVRISIFRGDNLSISHFFTHSVSHSQSCLILYINPSQEYLRRMSGKSKANFRHISGISLAYLMQISGIFQANLTHILGIYLRYISGKSLTNLWQIYYHYNLLMSITFVQITTMIIFAYNFYSHWYCASMYDPRTC